MLPTRAIFLLTAATCAESSYSYTSRLGNCFVDKAHASFRNGASCAITTRSPGRKFCVAMAMPTCKKIAISTMGHAHFR